MSCVRHDTGHSIHYFPYVTGAIVARYLYPELFGAPETAPNAAVKFLNTGHFALETDVEDIASAILKMPMQG